MKHKISLILVLSGVWLAWSGHTELLILALGAGSIVFVVWLSAHMKIVDSESVPTTLRYGRVIAYVPWLAREIVKANLDVARRILTPGPLPIAPRFVRVPVSQRTSVGQVIYANSITLTPGTISVDLIDGEILVHALSAEAAAGVADGVMDAKCAALEGNSE